MVLRGIRPDFNFKMFYVYILQSRQNRAYYVGSCKNIVQRLELHNHGRVPSTKRYVPWELVYQEEYDELKFARKRELQVKSWKKRASIENLIKHFKI